ncbi:MAG: hypothetical protein ACP6IT_04605 [Candidatus Thorarchaeota archaeon]
MPDCVVPTGIRRFSHQLVVATMGRTVKTFRDAIDSEAERWRSFRRTLQPSERELLDRIFEYSRAHADAGTMIVTPRTVEVVIVSALLEILKAIDRIEKQLTMRGDATE